MPGFLLHVGAVVTCPHGGSVQPVPPVPPRVLVSGGVVLVATTQLPVAGCTAPTPDAKAQWANMSTRVLIGGQPALLQAPPTGPGNGVCLSSGTPAAVVAMQTRVTAT
jgi:hypothetical protein